MSERLYRTGPKKYNSQQALDGAFKQLRKAHEAEWKDLLAKFSVATEDTPYDSRVTRRIEKPRPGLLSTTKAAEAIGVHQKTLVDWRNRQVLVPTFCWKSQSWGLYTAEDIERGRKLVGTMKPGRKLLTIPWRTRYGVCRKLLVAQHRAEYRSYYDALMRA